MSSFNNYATLSYKDSSVPVISNNVFGDISNSLEINKIARSAIYRPDQSIEYVITINNKTNNTYSNITVNDDLGLADNEHVPLTLVDTDIIYLVNNVETTPHPTVTIETDNTVNFSGITIPANSNVAIIYAALPNQYAQLETGSTIVNTASIKFTTVNSIYEDSATVTIADEPVLTIRKDLSPESVGVGDTVVYTFTIMNFGNTIANADSNIVVTDVFNPRLAIASVTLNDAAFTDYTYTGNVFKTNTGSITVEPATFSTDDATGTVLTTPGVAVLKVTGSVLAD